MCRIMGLDRKAFEWFVINGRHDFLSPYLAQLIKSNGGDGNGVAALYRTQGEISFYKSLLLRPEEATEWILDAYLAGAEHFLFHTRLASFGAVCAENCHPFIAPGVALIHNGHDNALVEVAKIYGYQPDGHPDSHAAAWLVSKFGPKKLETYSGNFLGWHRGKLFVVIGKGHWPLYRFEANNGGIWYCSEWPRHINEKGFRAQDLRPYIEVATPMFPLDWYEKYLREKDLKEGKVKPPERDS